MRPPNVNNPNIFLFDTARDDSLLAEVLRVSFSLTALDNARNRTTVFSNMLDDRLEANRVR